MRPFRRTRRAIGSSLHLINSSRQVIEASEGFAAERPVRTARQLERASGWLGEAVAQLGWAVVGLRETMDRAAQSPELALDAPGKLVDTAAQWIKAAGRLAAFSERLDDVSVWLFDSVKSGAIPIPIEEQTADAREAVTVFRRTAALCIPPDLLALEGSRVPCIPVRRQRPVCSAVAEAARRIFRGRAPPLLSTCSF